MDHAGNLGHKVKANFATEGMYGQGTIIAHVPRPSYIIRREEYLDLGGIKMSEAKMTKKENLRDSARGILDVLTRVEGNMNLLCGEIPCEVREELSQTGAVDELELLLIDTRYLADRIMSASDQLAERI